jgi:hypothetical protein
MAFDTSESKFNFRYPDFTNILLFLAQVHIHIKIQLLYQIQT